MPEIVLRNQKPPFFLRNLIDRVKLILKIVPDFLNLQQ